MKPVTPSPFLMALLNEKPTTVRSNPSSAPKIDFNQFVHNEQVIDNDSDKLIISFLQTTLDDMASKAVPKKMIENFIGSYRDEERDSFDRSFSSKREVYTMIATDGLEKLKENLLQLCDTKNWTEEQCPTIFLSLLGEIGGLFNCLLLSPKCAFEKKYNPVLQHISYLIISYHHRSLNNNYPYHITPLEQNNTNEAASIDGRELTQFSYLDGKKSYYGVFMPKGSPNAPQCFQLLQGPSVILDCNQKLVETPAIYCSYTFRNHDQEMPCVLQIADGEKDEKSPFLKVKRVDFDLETRTGKVSNDQGEIKNRLVWIALAKTMISEEIESRKEEENIRASSGLILMNHHSIEWLQYKGCLLEYMIESNDCMTYLPLLELFVKATPLSLEDIEGIREKYSLQVDDDATEVTLPSEAVAEVLLKKTKKQYRRLCSENGATEEKQRQHSESSNRIDPEVQKANKEAKKKAYRKKAQKKFKDPVSQTTVLHQEECLSREDKRFVHSVFAGAKIKREKFLKGMGDLLKANSSDIKVNQRGSHLMIHAQGRGITIPIPHGKKDRIITSKQAKAICADILSLK